MLVTVDRIDNWKATLGVIQSIPAAEKWMRLVIDPGGDMVGYHTVAVEARRRGIKVMVLPIDSYEAINFPTVDTYWGRIVSTTVQLGGDFDAVEVGNEYNGDWFGANATKKVQAAANYVKSKFPHALRIATLYLDPWDTGAAFKFLADEATLDLNVMLVSHYDRECPKKFEAWENVFSTIRAKYAGRNIRMGIGEFGPEAFHEDGTAWPPASLAWKTAAVHKYYGMKSSQPGFEQWGGYWDFVVDCVKNGRLLPALNDAVKI